MVSFIDIIQRLDNVGLSDAILPFFLIFVIIFAILQKSKILHSSDTDEKGRAFDVVVALVIGLIVIVPHVVGLYPDGKDVVEIMNAALPNIGIILIALVGFFLIIGLFGAKASWKGPLTGVISLVALLTVGYIFGNAAGWFINTPTWLSWLDDPDTQALLIVLAIFILVIYLITKKPSDDSADGDSSTKKLFNSIGELFGKND